MVDPVTFNVGSVTTTGDQTYSGTITLGANTVLTGANLTLAGVVGVGFNLTLTGSSLTTLGGEISGVGTFLDNGAGTTTITGGNIATTGDQSYSNPLTLGANTVLTGANLTLDAVTGGGFDLTLSGTGLTKLDGAVAGVHTLSSNNGGTTTVSSTIGAATLNMVDPVTLAGPSVTTTGDQTYSGTITLATVLVTLNGVSLSLAAVSGAGHKLALNGSGVTTLNGPVSAVGTFSSIGGGTTIIDSTLNALSVMITDAVTLNGGSVTTSGDQTYTNTITLGAATVLTGANLALAGVLGAGFDLTLTGSGLTTLGGAISGVHTLLDNGAGTTTITGGAITTTGDQTYSNPITLGTATLLTGVNLNLAGVTGAGFNLTLHGSLLTTLGGPISGVNTLTSNNGGTTVVNGTISTAAVKMIDPVTFDVGSVTTTGDQTYSGTITLATNTVLTGTNLTLAAVVGAGFDLTLHGSAVTTLGGPIIGVGTLTSDGGGTTIVNSTVSVATLKMIDAVTLAGGSITTTGDQTYSATITLGANTVLAGANLTLAGVNGAGFDLTLDGTGLTTLGGAISGVHTLTSNNGGTTNVTATISATTVNMVDPVTLAGGSVTTTGSQTYSGTITLGAPTVLTGVNLTLAAVVARASI